MEKLRLCQKTWLSGKLVEIKTWEIELLDDKSEELVMTLRDAMMALHHPTNPKFALFHSIDKHFRDACYVLTVLKSAESQAHSMIAAMLPYLLWQHVHSKSGPKASALKKWFSPTAWRRADDAYWCPKDECVKNQSDEMLAVTLADNNDLYWEMDVLKPPSPKRKRPQEEEELIDDTVSTINTAMSVKKNLKSVLKSSPSTVVRNSQQTQFASDNQTVTSQVTSISQLTDMVSAVQQENKTIMSRFDKLAEQMEALLAVQQAPNKSQSPAGGHRSESGHKK